MRKAAAAGMLKEYRRDLTGLTRTSAEGNSACPCVPVGTSIYSEQSKASKAGPWDNCGEFMSTVTGGVLYNIEIILVYEGCGLLGSEAV